MTEKVRKTRIESTSPKFVKIIVGGETKFYTSTNGEYLTFRTEELETIKNILANTGTQTLHIAIEKDIGVDFSPLVQMSSLEAVHLEFDEGAIKEETLNILSSCESLRTLKIETKQKTTLDLSSLTKSNITHLIVWAWSLSDIVLPEIKSVEQLALYMPGVSDIDLSPLRKSVDMTAFYMRIRRDNTDLAPLSSCTRLKEINLHDNRFTSIDLSPLQANTSLEVLKLSNNNLNNIDLEPLSKTPLQELWLDKNNLQRIDLKSLPRTIQTLVLSENELTYISLLPLRGSNIETLRLDSNKIRRINLLPLRGSNIETLRLGSNKIKRIDIEPLLKCQNLKKVSLGGNSIGSEVRHIAELATGSTKEELSLAWKGRHEEGIVTLSEWWSILFDKEMEVLGDEEIFPHWYLDALAEREAFARGS